jgi:hypothetical protein
VTRAEQRKLLRTLCNNMRDHLLAQSDRWPKEWDGHELRALVAREADNNLGAVRPDCPKRWCPTPQHARESRRRTKKFTTELVQNNL